MNDAFEMQIRGMTCILGAGINSALGRRFACVRARVCVCDMNSYMGVSVHVWLRVF